MKKKGLIADGLVFSKLEKKMSDLEIVNQKLKIMEEQYRLSLENVIDRIFIISTDLKILNVFPSMDGALGYKPKGIIGRLVSELGYIFVPDSFQQAMEDISFVLRGDSISARDYRFIAKDGSIKHGEISGSPMIREGKIIGMICVARDVTDRKLAEDSARESEKRYRELVDFLPIPIYEMDLEGNLTAANRLHRYGHIERHYQKW
jgi:PAS domain S-box-containing protein